MRAAGERFSHTLLLMEAARGRFCSVRKCLPRAMHSLFARSDPVGEALQGLASILALKFFGRRTVKTVPVFWFDSTEIVPPCASAVSRAT